MQIHPAHATVGNLLSTTGTFEVPHFQRNYAWGAPEVEAFLKDLEKCRRADAAGRHKHHFFGGVVTVTSPAAGSNRQNHELIDGQQRLATFMMLIAQLRHTMSALAKGNPVSPPEIKAFLEQQAELLSRRYEVYTDTINLRIVAVPRLRLTRVDHPVFEALLAGRVPVLERESHHRLLAAYNLVGAYLSKLTQEAADPAAAAAALRTILDVLEKSWTVIHMAAQSRSDAYMLFQVLNDRGLGLSDGELLRAAALEALEPIASAGEMITAENAWDEILNGREADIRRALQWIHASHIGVCPSSNSLLQDMQANLFPMIDRAPLDRAGANELIDAVRSLEQDMATITKIVEGEWPLVQHPTVYGWDLDRLRLLCVHLHQMDCIPLLVSATLLSPESFANVVQMLERFCFRYSIIVEAPLRDAMDVFHRQAVEIRRDPARYDIKILEKELRELVNIHASDEVFASRLKELRYPRGSESRKPLKYFLMTLEHYVRWFDEGAQGRPTCRDRTRVLDFENSTIEHIHPDNAAWPDPQLDSLVDDLGNLTILSPQENNAAGAKPFMQKRSYLSASSSTLNKQVADLPAWTAQAVQDRQRRLINMALRVFSL